MHTTGQMTICVLILLLTSVGLAADEREPIELGQHRQLFVDDYVIADMQDVKQVLNQPQKHPANPVVWPEHPWEGDMLILYGSVVYDDVENIFKLWYVGWREVEGVRGLYATSKDGLHWDKPQLGLVNYEGATANNRIPWFAMGMVHSPDDPDPARRYKSLSRRRGTASPTGVSFEALPGSENIPGVLASDNVIPFCYDELESRYIAFPKVVRTSGAWKRRSVSVAVSKDFSTWNTAETVLVPDARDDELARERVAALTDRVAYDSGPEWHNAQFYGMCGFPYEGMYLGMLWVFDISGWAPGKAKIPGIGGEDGPSAVELTSSRDRSLLNWQRVCDRDVFIPVGDVDTFDGAIIYTANRPIIVGDEIWIYYSGNRVGHAHPMRRPKLPADYELIAKTRAKGPIGGVGLATLRLDGWVSVDAGHVEGILTTKSLIFEGKKKLVINANAASGSIGVEIMDQAGQPLPGFAKSDCDTFIGDAIRHTVVWNGRSDISELAGKPVSLRFYLQDAKLFSFTAAEVPAAPAL